VTTVPRAARVLPEGTIDKTFDYLVPEALGDQVRVGTLVRVELNGRRVRAWVVADDVEPPAGVTLRPLAKVTGWGPDPGLVDLAGWAAWRWAGRRSWFLGTASPPGAVRTLPAPVRRRAPATRGSSPSAALAEPALARSRSVVRLPPLTDPFDLVAAVAGRGPTLVLAPSVGQAGRLGNRLRRAGATVAVLARPTGDRGTGSGDWAVARAGADVVVGTRAAAWAPVEHLAAAVVLDEHEEVYQEEQTTTWHARDVVAERARRAGIPCVLVSPTPSLEALGWAGVRGPNAETGLRGPNAETGLRGPNAETGLRGPNAETGVDGLIVPDRRSEREGWPLLEVVDRRDEEPGRTGLYSERLVKLLRDGGRVVCILNRKGRSRLLACATCGEAARCERCSAAVAQAGEANRLVCRHCGLDRPVVCQGCGGTRLKNLIVGVSRAREELEALVREPVAEISAPDRKAAGESSRGAPAVPPDPGTARVIVGTEAALHQVAAADVVAFLDFDQELLAPRYRAAEQALALLVRGARLLARGAARRPDAGSGRAGHGRLVVQTRVPHHEVVQAAVAADPARVADAEWERRQLLSFPPVTALAAVSGPAAGAFVSALAPGGRSGGGAFGIEVMGPADGRWLVRAPDHRILCDALAATPRPATGRLRIEVDPARI
jgi:primosomal protein N' (replication factor Y)